MHAERGRVSACGVGGGADVAAVEAVILDALAAKGAPVYVHVGRLRPVGGAARAARAPAAAARRSRITSKLAESRQNHGGIAAEPDAPLIR